MTPESLYAHALMAKLCFVIFYTCSPIYFSEKNNVDTTRRIGACNSIYLRKYKIGLVHHLNLNRIILGPAHLKLCKVGWFKMHDVFRYWLPGHFWEGLYVK